MSQRSHQTRSTEQLVEETQLDWFHECLERDLAVCNNCFGRRTDPGQAVTDAYEDIRSAGRATAGGGPRERGTAAIYCNNCGVGYGLDDLADLEVVDAETIDVSDIEATPQDQTTGQAWLVRSDTRYSSPGNQRVASAADGFETVDEDRTDEPVNEAEASWRLPTHLTQSAAREALGSIGRSWSERDPMPKRGETPSTMRCVTNAVSRLQERGFDVHEEKAKRMAARLKSTSKWCSRDREILAGALYKSTTQPADQ